MIQTNTLLATAARKGFTLEFIGANTRIDWVGPYVMEGKPMPATIEMKAGDWNVTLEEMMGEWVPTRRHNVITGTESRCGAWFDNLMK